jgi:hypothetical protein
MLSLALAMPLAANAAPAHEPSISAVAYMPILFRPGAGLITARVTDISLMAHRNGNVTLLVPLVDQLTAQDDGLGPEEAHIDPERQPQCQ